MRNKINSRMHVLDIQSLREIMEEHANFFRALPVIKLALLNVNLIDRNNLKTYMTPVVW